MSKKNKQKWMSFKEEGDRWMICKVCQSEYVCVDDDTVAVTCSNCVIKTSFPFLSIRCPPTNIFGTKFHIQTFSPTGLYNISWSPVIFSSPLLIFQ